MYMLQASEGYYYIQNFLLLIKGDKKLLNVGKFVFISKINEEKS